MKEIIQTAILEALSNKQNYRGQTFFDKFDTLSATDFAEGIYENLPLYTDEHSNIIINTLLHAYEDKATKVEFLINRIKKCTSLFILQNNIQPETLIALSFWSNVLNKFLYDTDLYKEEDNYRNYLISFLFPNINSIEQQVKIDNIQGITKEVGSYFIRLDNNNNFIPTEKTKEEFKQYNKL